MNCHRIGAGGLAALLFVLFLSPGRAILSLSWWPQVWAFTNHGTEMEVHAVRDAELEAQRGRLNEEISFASYLAARLAGGQLSLREAVTQMEPILCQRPGFRTACGGWSSVDCTRRRTARYLIQKVKAILDARQWPVVSARLEAEYFAMR
jgi:hypothetical protein